MNLTEPPPPETSPPWYVEHRMRALLALIGGFLLFGATVFTIVFVTTVNRLKTTVPYEVTAERVVEHPGVQNLLGRPVAPTWRAAGQVNEDTGYTEMTFRIAGPTGKGTVRAKLRRDVGVADSPWEIVFLDVACFSDFGVEVVSIVEDEPPTGPELPEPTPEAREKYGVE
ncbi:MAG: cytochrome c oxidase assembly factor Coa1 family protein [Planctomycetota bacterium]